MAPLGHRTFQLNQCRERDDVETGTEPHHKSIENGAKQRPVRKEHVPLHGPALLVPNHVSLVDPFLVAGGVSRVIHFLMFRNLFQKPLFRGFVTLMKAIPISEHDSPKEIMKSLLQARKQLEAGHLVCIFAEGEISRLGGATLGFKRGLDVILKGMENVPVIPVHLEGVWGSIFSFVGKKFLWKWPKKIPYPVTLSFGKPLLHTTSADVRQAVIQNFTVFNRRRRAVAPNDDAAVFTREKTAVFNRRVCALRNG